MNAHRIRLEPTQLTVEPGSEAVCTVRVWNTGDVVDAYVVEVLGAAAAWTEVEPASVSLFPGADGVARLTFRPPRTPEALAGPLPFAVRVRSQDAGMTTSIVEEGSLEVAPFTELAAELLPRTSHARFSGRHRVRVTNRGNAPAAVHLSGSDAEQAVDLAFSPPALTVPAGAVASSGVRARCTSVSWTAAPKQWAFQVTAQAADTQPVQMQGALEQLPVIGRWTRRAIAVAAVGLVALTVLHFRGAEIQSAAANLLSGNRASQVGAPGQSPGAASPVAQTSPTTMPSTGPSRGTGGTNGGTNDTGATGAPPVVAAAACAGNAISFSAPNAAQAIPGLSVTFDNGTVGRTALIDVSANLGVDVDAEVRVAYSVDGGPAQENAIGPANFANTQEYYEARAVSAVTALGPGSHTVAAFWRISGAAGKTAHMDKRCLTVRNVAAAAPDASPIVASATCAGNAISYSAPNAAQAIPGLTTTINNGGSSRRAMVTISANLGVDIDAEVRVAYSVDGTAAQENVFGPANLANHQEYYEGREVTAVIPLGPGSHTITAYWRISGAAGKTAYMDRRCLSVESASSAATAASTCTGGSVSTTASGGGQPMPGLSVSVNNGSSARTALVAVSANMGVDLDAETRVAYSVDGGPAQENAYGPANLANHQEYYEGRAATAVIPLGPGSHTITAYWRVSGATGKAATMDERCLTAESVG
ncbi:MAG TPA: hypothetical protein VE953_19120 [Terriglobales bacterium]|nr:hypothetical protein [Terriglobales bacterium]